MNYRRLGNSSLNVSEVGFGCMSLSSQRENEAIEIIEKAIDYGVNFFDTADLYEFGLNEELVGKAIKGKRNDLLIATKVGNRMNENKDGWSWDPSKKYIKEAVHQSLKRLQTDYIDLYQLHGGTIEDHIDETIEAFEELKQEGLIREYGISSIRPNVIKQYIEKSSIVSIMMPYGLLDRRAEEFFDLFHRNEISIIARGSLCKGILTNRWQAKLTEAGFLDYTKEEMMKLTEQLSTFVHDDRNLTQIALQYALHHQVVATVIPGASRVEQLIDNVKASSVTKLTDSEMELINGWTKTSKFTAHR